MHLQLSIQILHEQEMVFYLGRHHRCAGGANLRRTFYMLYFQPTAKILFLAASILMLWRASWNFTFPNKGNVKYQI